MRKLLIASVVAIIATVSITAIAADKVKSPFAKWPGFAPKNDPYFFPIAVYTQNPKNAGKYKELGINLYCYLWKGPTAGQIAELKKHNMRVIAELNEYAKKNLLKDPIVAGWTQMDEPDLAKFSRNKLLVDQVKAKKLVKEHWPEMYKKMDLDNKDYAGWGFGYSPEYCKKHYQEIKKLDPQRPVLMGLSKAVVGRFVGRGDRTPHNEDYPKYINGTCDIAAFDIYPVAYGKADQLNLVPKGVDNLNKWDKGNRPKWVAIECTFGRPDNPSASAGQIRSEIWMSIIRGARAIGYFVHNFNKKGGYVRDSGLLIDPEMMKAVKKQNAEIKSLAKVIYAPEIKGLTLSTKPEVKLDFVAKKVDGAVYIFAATMATEATEAAFAVKGIKNGTVEVINENRTIPVKNGKFKDAFKGYDVHLYKID